MAGRSPADDHSDCLACGGKRRALSRCLRDRGYSTLETWRIRAIRIPEFVPPLAVQPLRVCTRTVGQRASRVPVERGWLTTSRLSGRAALAPPVGVAVTVEVAHRQIAADHTRT